MNCFVIMPFAPEFDDVYETIKSSVESITPDKVGRCFRLDESRPAGRITDRLLAELRSATLCVADITGSKPNVMWEVGFAMALKKPTIIITQELGKLPFDIKDMQTIEYDRGRLGLTLRAPLRRSILDTLGDLGSSKVPLGAPDTPGSEAIGSLLVEVSQLKEMVSEAVHAWKSGDSKVPQTDAELAQLTGNWVNQDSGSHVYSRLVRGELVAPYCYTGNAELTGVYYAWRRMGDYWFARYQWLGSQHAGFTFLRQETTERMSGAWWSSEDEIRGASSPPKRAGVQSTWVRQAGQELPTWAAEFCAEVERNGLAAVLADRG